MRRTGGGTHEKELTGPPILMPPRVSKHYIGPMKIPWGESIPASRHCRLHGSLLCGLPKSLTLGFKFFFFCFPGKYVTFYVSASASFHSPWRRKIFSQQKKWFVFHSRSSGRGIAGSQVPGRQLSFWLWPYFPWNFSPVWFRRKGEKAKLWNHTSFSFGFQWNETHTSPPGLSPTVKTCCFFLASLLFPFLHFWATKHVTAAQSTIKMTVWLFIIWPRIFNALNCPFIITFFGKPFHSINM